MAIRNPQAPNAVVRHHHFCPNPQTLTNNAFQLALRQDLDGLPALAYRQASDMAARPQEHGIQVHIFEDETQNTPDSVFPNNWFSTHSGGMLPYILCLQRIVEMKKEPMLSICCKFLSCSGCGGLLGLRSR
jgi:hypothetical protein